MTKYNHYKKNHKCNYKLLFQKKHLYIRDVQDT
ncbi:MAG: hypothetical protein K0Q87_2827 [Neobacillus sp.]|nr:hypothetical protein [Neobacillus sp.]